MSISGNAALDVFIGLAFFYFLLSVVSSAINEGIATALNLRAKELEKGIRNLLYDPAKAAEFYNHWRVKALFKPKRFLAPVFKHKLPSYIPSRVFALTLLDTFAPPANGTPRATPDSDLIARAQAVVAHTRDSNPRVSGLLQDALDEARNDTDRFRAAVEQAFNEAMDRVSGWYKRRVQLILFVIALALVGTINADSSTLAQRLWKNDELRASVVAAAKETIAADSKAPCANDAGVATPAERAAKCIDQVKQLNIPLGWTKATSPHSLPDGLGKVLGLLVTAFALTLGAPFWFDLLGKVAQLRGSGPSPKEKKSAHPDNATVAHSRHANGNTSK